MVCQKVPLLRFNSHALSADGGLDPDLAETYVNQLITDLHADLEDFGLSPSIHSIFIGGGTPSCSQSAPSIVYSKPSTL